MSASEAKDVEVSANINGTDIHPVSVTVSGTVNAFIEGNVRYISKAEPAEKSATDITSKDVIDVLAKFQTDSFHPANFSSSVNMTDAEGGSLSLGGCVSSPVYTFSVSEFGCDVRLQPEVAQVNAIDMSIYPGFFICSEVAVEALDISNYETVPDYFLGVFNYFLQSGKKAIEDADIPDADKKNRLVQHEINEKASKFVAGIMGASTSSFGWGGLLEALNSGGGGEESACTLIRDRIVNILKKRNGGFFNNILNFASEFQCVYVPDSGHGKLVNYKELLTGGSSTQELGIISMAASVGSRGMFPVCCVGAAGLTRRCADLNMGERAEYAIYPKSGPKDLGTMEVIQGPSWLPDSMWNETIVPKSNHTVQQLKLPPEEAKVTVQQIQKNADGTKAAMVSIIDQWVENEYYWNALGQTYATVVTELATGCSVGQRVKLKSKGGSSLFTGTIWKITHSVVSGENADATSKIEFSHIIMNGATIPGIENAS